MKQQPDKLFSDKLRSLNRPVSANAWARVVQNRNRHRVSPWLKIAASLLLVAAAGVLLFPWRSDDAGPVSQNTVKPALENSAAETPRKETPGAPQAADTSITEGLPGEQPAAPDDGQEKNAATPPPRKNVPQTDQAINPINPLASTSDLSPAGNNTVAPSNEAVSDEPVATEKDDERVALATESDAVTITLTASEVDEKYLRKSSVVEATPAPEESSTLKKLLDKARDLKTNQDPLGHLRALKNEVLAFNFKGDKQHNN